MRTEDTRHISIRAPGRLHLGFIDLHGGLGRKFGSLGLALAEVATTLTATRSERAHCEGPSSERALEYAETVLRRLSLPGSVSIQIEEAVPEHAGLGSGTQLALAVSAVVSRLFGLSLDTARLAALTERGMRSGIGIGAFAYGGFLVDGGRGSNSLVPPVISRCPFPTNWRVLLIFDHAQHGLHGQRERDAFEQLPQMQEAAAGDLSRRVLIQMLPALAEQDFSSFVEAVTYVQNAVGDLFSAVQGGRYTSQRVAAVLDWLQRQGVRGFGQSSWGPTGFAFFESERAAQQVASELRQCWGS